MAFLISIPVPPSVNAMYANSRNGRGRGRYKTASYKQWIDEAGWEIKAQNPAPVTGKYRLRISLPPIRGDADNRVKAVADLLVSLRLTPDDRHMVGLSVEVLEEQRGHAIVSVEDVAGGAATPSHSRIEGNKPNV